MKSQNIFRKILSGTALLLSMLTAAYASGDDEFLDCPAGMVDSSDAIQNGLWNTRDGGTLHLGQCTYYVTRTIEARWNHHGKMQGMGKELTTIEILPGAKIAAVPITVEGGYYLSPLFLFENPESGDITLSDLSVVVTDPQPAQGNDPFFSNGLWTLIAVTGPDVNTRFENAGFHGAPGDFFGTNIGHGIQIYNYPGLNGSMTVSGCDFSSIWDSMNPFNFQQAIIDISGNTFANTGFGAIVENCSGCTVRVSQNTMEQVSENGVFIIHDDAAVPLDPSNYLVERNSIDLVSANGNGIWVLGSQLSAVVAQNKLHVESNEGAAGIFALGPENLLIANNKVDGTGFSAILTLFASGGTIIGNNVQNFETLPWSPAAITLWESWDFRVVGGHNSANLTWEGGGGHVFTGVNVSENPDLGPQVSDALEFKREVRKTMP